MTRFIIVACLALAGCEPSPELVRAVAATCEKQSQVVQVTPSGAVYCHEPKK